MRERRRGRDRLRVLRRGVGLGLALVTVWGVGLTADLSGVGEAVRAWSADSQAVVGLLAEQLGQVPEETALAGMDGLGRLMVEQSALLSAGLEAVDALRQEQEGVESTPPTEEPPEVEDNDDQTAPQLQPPAEPDDVREMTGVGREGGQYFSQNGVYLYDRTNKGLDPSVFDAGAVHFGLGEGPQILILHSHGSEAYSQNDGDLYQESDAYRTTDCTHNVVRVGEAMAEVFRSQGLQVIHDTNLYDYPAYNGWPSIPPSGSSWTSTGTPWWAATAPSISWSPRRMGKRPPRSCWWWAPTAAGRSTRTGSTIWPWPSGSSRSWSPTM